MTQGNRGKGVTYAWIVAHLDYEGDDCLKWPFSISPQGRGMMSHNGERWYASRLMCKLIHGDPPTPEHEAAHECGNGHLACMNRKHLFWKTRSQNRLDSRKHGTSARSHYGKGGKLTPEQRAEVMALKGVEPAMAVAERYGIHFNSIYMLWGGHTFSKPHKEPVWTPEEDAKIRDGLARGLTYEQIASEVGRPAAGVSGRASRIRLRSPRSQPFNRDIEYERELREAFFAMEDAHEARWRAAGLIPSTDKATTT